jgi:outer membrane biogenesis lipoprotein LolB
MKLKSSLLPLCISLLACLSALNPSCRAQEDRRQKQEQNPQQNQYRDQSQVSAQQADQQNVQTFAGKVSQKGNTFFLDDPLHKTPYRLADTWDAKRFLNKKVRVSGSLDTEHNILHVKSITRVP